MLQHGVTFHDCFAKGRFWFKFIKFYALSSSRKPELPGCDSTSEANNRPRYVFSGVSIVTDGTLAAWSTGTVPQLKISKTEEATIKPLIIERLVFTNLNYSQSSSVLDAAHWMVRTSRHGF